MVTTDDIKEMVSERVNAHTIRKAALKAGMVTLRQYGWKKVLQGVTTIEEVARTTAGDVA